MSSFGHSQSFIGRRSNNEDCELVNDDLGLYVVADGMGGHEGGEVASNLAVDIIHHFFERVGDRRLAPAPAAGQPTEAEDLLDVAFRMAHREVARERVGTLEEMGTTLVTLLLRDGCAIVGHVGDSRAYRMRDGKLEQLTRDHSLYAEMEAAGIASALPTARAFSHVITRAIGVTGNGEPDITTVDTRPGDVFLLCTDGLTDVVPDERIEIILRELPPHLASAALVGEAWMSESRDNVTVVLATVD